MNENIGRKKIPCEVYSRIVGYLRPVRGWNMGKIVEWKERRVYHVDYQALSVVKEEENGAPSQ